LRAAAQKLIMGPTGLIGQDQKCGLGIFVGLEQSIIKRICHKGTPVLSSALKVAPSYAWPGYILGPHSRL
jgi:hypothetical protein